MNRLESQSVTQAQKPNPRLCVHTYMRLLKRPLSAPPMLQHPSAGFTLIEVLVALFIVSVSVLAGLRAASSMTQNAGRQWQMLLAQTCADNALVQLRISPQYANLGEHESSCEQASHEMRIQLTVAATPNPSFRRVDVQVLDNGTPLLRVTGLHGRF